MTVVGFYFSASLRFVRLVPLSPQPIVIQDIVKYISIWLNAMSSSSAGFMISLKKSRVASATPHLLMQKLPV